LGEQRVVASAALTIPPWESPQIDNLGLSQSEMDAYVDLVERITPGEQIHRVLGWPDQIQADMQLECQLVTHGLYVGDETGFDDPRARELARGAEDWRLLLQLDSDETIGMMWGDVGRLYWWIREADLRTRRFDASWLILQCG